MCLGNSNAALSQRTTQDRAQPSLLDNSSRQRIKSLGMELIEDAIGDEQAHKLE